MGKKKGAKKLKQQQQQQQQQQDGAADQAQVAAQQPAAGSSLAPASASAPGQQQRHKRKPKPSKFERNARKQQEAQAQAQAQAEAHTRAQAQAPTAYSTPAGHGKQGSRSEGGVDLGDGFVGQSLLDALESGEPGGAEALATAAEEDPRRRPSLSLRLATSSTSGSLPNASAHARAAVGGARLESGGEVARRGLPSTTPTRPRSWAKVAHSRPAPSSAPRQPPATEASNPHGYNVENATWKWNSVCGAGGAGPPAGGPAAGNWRSVRQQPTYQPSNEAYWPGASGGMSETFHQRHYPQQYVEAHGGGVRLQPQQQQQISTHEVGYRGSGFNGVRHIHGHTNAFTTRTPATANLNRGFATLGGRRASGLMSPERTSGDSEDGEIADGGQPRRSGRLVAKPKLLPVPKPTPGYLAQASVQPQQTIYPQQLLIIIDLNGTLVHRPHRRNPTNIICRPYVPAFIRYILDNHHVMVWSSARPENVKRMCAQLFVPEQRAKLMAEWGRDMLGLSAAQYNEKVQVYKQLKGVWDQALAAKWHPQHDEGERFGQHNTLLIDDSILKANSEPFNLVQVDEFEAKPDQMRGDVLRQVVGYLEEARRQRDVSAWIRSGRRFVVGGGWDWTWPEGTLAQSLPAGPGQVMGNGHGW